jgi:peroxiredoxin
MKRFVAAAAALALGLSLALPGLAQDSRPTSAPASKQAPDFTLTDVKGQKHTLSDYTKAGKVVVLEWFNPDCPFVKKHHKRNKTMAELYAKYKEQGVVWLAINSGYPGKQGAGKDRNLRAVEEYGIKYPVLLDEDGAVGRKYSAKVTPHMFVIDAQGKVAFEGAIDDDRRPKVLGKKNYVAAALDAVLAGKPAPDAAARPYGCSVKYGPRN